MVLLSQVTLRASKLLLGGLFPLQAVRRPHTSPVTMSVKCGQTTATDRLSSAGR